MQRTYDYVYKVRSGAEIRNTVVAPNEEEAWWAACQEVDELVLGFNSNLLNVWHATKGRQRPAANGTPHHAVTVIQLRDSLNMAIEKGYGNFGVHVSHDGTWGWVRDVDDQTASRHYNAGFRLSTEYEKAGGSDE